VVAGKTSGEGLMPIAGAALVAVIEMVGVAIVEESPTLRVAE
jgi:hypothetical protein